MQNKIDNYISNLLVPETTNILLEKFEPYDKEKSGYYKDMQGVYAFFLTEELNFSNVGFYNKEEIETLNKKLINTNEKLKNNKNLIYIGKTHNNNSFDGRVTGERGHMQGGVSNLTGKIFHYLTGEYRTKYGTEYYHQYKKQIKTWFETYTEVKFLPLYNKKGEKEKQLKNSDMVISLIEEVLIDVYRPALNKDSKKSKMK